MAPRRELTAFEKTIPDYRKRILVSLTKALLVPPLLVSLVLRLVCRSPSFWLYLSLALLSIPISVGLRSYYTVWAQDREAARMGAQPITRVRGRWPGNLDVVLRMLKSFESGYVLQGFAELFAEYGCTTLNTRFFWDDQVSLRRVLIPADRTGYSPPRIRSSPWTRKSSGSWRTPVSPTSKRAFYGTSACTSFIDFPAPSPQALIPSPFDQ
jgi:hypothetical protein